MVGGLVRGALEKFYCQPSLLARALLAACVNFSRLGKRAVSKKPCPPPTSTQVGLGCAFRTRLSSTPLATLPRARLTYARRTPADTPECGTLLPAPRRHAPRDRPDVRWPPRSRRETAPQRSDGGTAAAPVLMVISCSLPRGTWWVTPVCPLGGVCQAGGWKVIRKMEDFCKIFQRPTPREPVHASLGPRGCHWRRATFCPLCAPSAASLWYTTGGQR